MRTGIEGFTMSVNQLKSRLLCGAGAALLALPAGQAAAFQLDLFETPVQVDTLFTIGATFRMQDIDHSLISKSTLNPGLCLQRVGNPGNNSTDPGPRGENKFTAGRGFRQVMETNCASSDLDDIQDYVAAPGSYAFSNDDGNLQFEKGDIVHAVAKLSSDISFSVFDFNVFLRPVAFFDQVYDEHEIRWPDTTLRNRVSEYPDDRKDINAFTIDLLDAHIGRSFEFMDRAMSVKVGKQVLNWGESSLLLFNSLNSINPPDARRLRLPGLDLKEVLQPVNMITFNTDVMDNVGLEVFYALEWRGLVFDPVGAFQNPADIFGEGGDYAMLGLGKAPEDPDGLYQAIDTCNLPTRADFDPTAAPGCADSLGLLGSTSSRTARVEHIEPSDSGQFGFAVKTFLEDFNNGTELSFYFANYHSRFPIVSAIAAPATCIGQSVPDSTPAGLWGAAALAAFPVDCEYMGPGVAAGQEPIPIDRARLLVEYPEDVQMYGVSFNTTIGDWALSGEYAYRPNLPVQVHTVDLTFAALLPAFPRQDVSLGAVTLPGRQSAFPTFITRYRGLACSNDANCIQPGQYVAGYEEMESGQLNLTLVKIIGGDNPLGASQITFLFETGLTHTLDFPGLSELQFNGGGTNTHISGGADLSQGIDPPPVPGNSRAAALRQNPTAHADYEGFGSEYAWGYRNINIVRWDDALFGANLQGLAIIRHDVNGTSPGIGTNFTDGRKEFNLGLSFDYLSTWIGEVRYTWFTGAEGRDPSRDKDNIFVTLGYQF